MKKIIFFLFFLTNLNLAFTQSCGIIDPSTNIHTKFTTTTQSLDVNVYWHIVKDDNGNSQNSDAMYKDVINKAVKEFAKNGIHLKSYCDEMEHNINVINSTSLTIATNIYADDFDFCIYTEHCLSDGLNVFLLHGTGLQKTGFGLHPGNIAFVKIEAVTDYAYLMHEIGHCFGVFHTFHGREAWIGVGNQEYWECDNQAGVTGSVITTPSCDGSSVASFVPFEFVNGLNGDTSADFVKDTPATIPLAVGCPGYYECEDNPCNSFLSKKRNRDPNCEIYKPDFNNYMTNRGNCRDHFTAGQISRAKAIIETYLQYMLIPQDLVIDSDRIFEMDGAFNSIIIDEGVTLTVKNSNILMEEGSSIYLRKDATILLDNSTLTSCGQKWQGVFCDKKADKVELINSSRIENAEIGIRLASTSWSVTQNHPTLIMNHSAIRFCDIGVQFGHGKTNSVIENQSAISSCDIGVKYVNHSGLIIDNSIFNANVDGTSIESMDGYMHVRDQNLFIGGNVGISVEGTLPLFGAIDIGDAGLGFNVFFSQGQVAIGCNGLESPTGANIVNCSFNNSVQNAVLLGGSTEYKFENNNIEGAENGVVSFATGDNFNFVKCNTFTDVDNMSNSYAFVNNRSQFLENSFDGTQNINNALLTAEVSEEIGIPANPAANCFLGTDIYTGQFLNLGNSIPFNYHYYDDSNDANCQEPVNEGTYSKIKVFDQGEGYCLGDIGIFNLTTSDGGGNGIIPTTYDPDDACLDCIRDSIQSWIDIIVNDGGDDPRTETSEEDPDHDPLLPQHEQLLDQWINFAIYVAIEIENYDYGAEVLKPLGKWRWQKRLFALQIMSGDIIEAETTLESLSENTLDQTQFKQLQRINLKRIKGEHVAGTITSAESDLVHDIAIGYEPTNGYARSLYHILTGIRLPYIVPDLRGEGTPRSDTSLKEVELYPNPANDRLGLSFADRQIMTIHVYDQMGNRKILLNPSNRSKVEIDISQLSAGLYIVLLEDINKVKLVKKFIKL